MSNKLVLFIKNFSYAFSSNMISFLINAFILLTIPKVIGVTEYGYFQYYTLLTTYLFVLHFGWIDGIYLRYGGLTYNELDSHIFSQQFWGFFIFCFAQITLYLTLLNNISLEYNKYFIFLYVILSIIFVLPKTFISIVLQATNRMKEYSVLLIIERIFYAIILVVMLICGVTSFKILLLADLAGKLFSLIYGIKCCYNIVFTYPIYRNNSFVVIKDNISAGIFLVLSNLCSMFTTGIMQFFIENRWNIETFSKISLTFNISRMIMLIINSISVVMFPLIKNVRQEELENLYVRIRKATMIILMSILIFYYPLRSILTIWLPQFSDSFRYVALLLPMCIFESKSVMLVNTYLKVLRKENVLFTVNLIIVIMSVLFSFIMVYIISSLELAILSITILLMIKSIFLEYFITKFMPVKITKEIIIEFLIVSIFMICSWFISPWASFMIYLIVYSIYLFIHRTYLNEIINRVRYRETS
jgi:O-antigen/teichoic acid export membrane protein